MKIAEKIEKRISKMSDGSTFGYQELDIPTDKYSTAAKAIERLLKKGFINRVSTGIFYKPQKTVFGPLKPNEEELLRPYLFENNRRIAYITGTSLYNKMGLTTQVPKNIKVASRGKRFLARIGSLSVTSVKSYVEVTDENFYLLELLDVLKDFKIIPDSNKAQTIRFMLKKIDALSAKEKELFIKIAVKYPPRVRAFSGALVNQLDPKRPLKELKKSINPLSTFEFRITKDLLSTIQYWNIY